ncbi:MAG: hypothetical protein ABIW82_13365 [Dokdonella sp.]
MFPSHSTKLAAKLWLAGIVCAIAATGWAGATAAGLGTEPLRVEFAPAAAGGANSRRLIDIHGTAPARCAPTLGRVTVDGVDVSIELQTPHSACDDALELPFTLQVDVARATGLALLPGQVYRVRIYSMTSAAATLAGFHLLDTNTVASAPAPENGFWWSEAGEAAGSSASLELQDGQLAVGFFGFTDSGLPTWYFGTARPHGRIAAVPLVHLANGDPMFAPIGNKPTAAAGPRLEIEFTSPTQARAWLVRSERGRDVQVRSLLLARSQFSAGAPGTSWSGQWVLVPDDKGTPRVFEFADPSSHDAESFHLSDAGDDATLDCRLSSASRQPELCTLSTNSTPIADFDQIGLDHLTGRGSDGARMKLVRIPR